jgi:DNA-binding CsgD family transcriptional regulator
MIDVVRFERLTRTCFCARRRDGSLYRGSSLCQSVMHRKVEKPETESLMCWPALQSKIDNGVKIPYFNAMTCVAGRRMSNPRNRVELTRLERAILLWMSRGKSITDISDILRLSPKAVRYHLAKARDRYGCATAIQTVVRAAQDYGFNPGGREVGDTGDGVSCHLESAVLHSTHKTTPG